MGLLISHEAINNPTLYFSLDPHQWFEKEGISLPILKVSRGPERRGLEVIRVVYEPKTM